ncbi:MAG: methyl-accepting chemotaxis protein [Lentisphaeraceae bacterium]|nr:methyl-accepting chemotaxis protein [Lentisphaeraceae bacterium]
MKNLKLWKKIFLGAAVPLSLMAILGYRSSNSMNELTESSKWVDHTHSVIEKAMKIEGSAVNMETGMRGYLLAGKEEFLEPYNAGQSSFYTQVNELKKTVSDNPAQVKLLEEIESNISAWQANVTEPMIELRENIGDSKTMDDMADEVGKKEGKKFFDSFREKIALFRQREEDLMKVRQKSAISTNAEGQLTITKLHENTGWVDHTHVVIQKAMNIIASAVDMETGMRGYLLAGKEEFLEPYNSGKKSFFERVKALQKTVSDNPSQVTLLEEISSNILAWQTNITEPAILLRRSVVSGEQEIAAVVNLVGQGKGKAYFDKFRGQIATFIEREETLMQKRQLASEAMSIKTGENLKKLEETNGWVDHTHVVIQQAMTIEAAAVDMETGMRGYLLAGKEEFLEPYNNGRTRFDSLVASLQKTVSDNPAQVKLLDEIRTVIHEWIENVVSQNIALRREIGDADTMNDMAKLVGKAEGKTYFDKFRGQIETFIGREEVLMEARKKAALSTASTTQGTILWGTVITLIISAIIFWILSMNLTRPMRAIVGNLKDIAQGEGDLTKRLDVQSTDEIGEVSSWFNEFVDKLQAIISQVQSGSNALVDQTHTVAEKSSSITESVEGMNNQAKSVSKSSKKMSENVKGMAQEIETMNSNTEQVSALSEQMTDAMNLVAAAVEESQIGLSSIAEDSVAISGQISDIVNQTTEGESLSKEAVNVVTSANEKISKLSEASEEISKVVEIIIEISEQTKNLALNATIEAARAGEAGKGFAVVASEVKELAKQTNDATSQIQSRIDAIKGSTSETVTEIESVGNAIYKLNEIVVGISGAMNDQKEKVNSSSVASSQAASGLKEIAQNVAQVNEGINEINGEISSLKVASNNVAKTVAENKTQTSDVTGNIEDMHDSLGRNSKEVSEISDTASEMATKAGVLQELVDKFKV